MFDNQKMLAEQRRGVILEELGRIGSVSVADLSRKLKVSDMTIRRDLEELSGRRLLRKVHGGAIPVSRSSEPHFEQKRRLKRPEKVAIARAAQEFLNDGDTVAFSAGTTTWHVASTLYPGHKDLTFVTNSTNVALTLQEHGWDRIVLSGGMFRTPSDALVGPFADRTLRTLNADVLFLGANGCLVEAAQRVVVVADSSKLGVVALARIIPLSRVDVFITDQRAPKQMLREIELSGPKVVVAESA
jgi:DeoR/GlpR family transcriptional regulator of sugar metabolism